MSTIHQSPRRFFGIIAVLGLTLLAPGVVTAEEEVAALAPVSAPSVAGTSADEVRAAAHALAAERALQSGDIGSMQEEHLLAIVAAAPSPDATSGCGSVEASRAANAIPVAPAASTTQVPAGVRWAPAGTIGPESSSAASRAMSPSYLPVALGTGTRSESVHLATVALPDDSMSADSEQTRVVAAQHALLSPDLGSLQEDALTAVVEASSAEAES